VVKWVPLSVRTIAELCRREGIASSMYYGWSKEFLETNKKQLAGDTARAATSDEVKGLRLSRVGSATTSLKACASRLLLKKKHDRRWGDEA
jgi:transposase